MVTNPTCQISEGASVQEMLMYIDFDLTADIQGKIRVYYDHRSDDDDKIVKVIITNECELEFVAGKYYSWSEALTDCIDQEIDLLSQKHKIDFDQLHHSIIVSDIFLFLNEKGFDEETFCSSPDSE